MKHLYLSKLTLCREVGIKVMPLIMRWSDWIGLLGLIEKGRHNKPKLIFATGYSFLGTGNSYIFQSRHLHKAVPCLQDCSEKYRGGL